MPDQAPPSADVLENRLAFETLISHTSAALLTGPVRRVDLAVEHALERVRDFFQADRCALLSVRADQRAGHVQVASYSEGVSRVSPDVNLVELFPWAARKLLVEREAVRVSTLAALPPEAAVDRASWEAMEVRSNLALPIETGADVRHLIVLHTVHRERAWPDALVTRLRVLGDLLVGALERGRADEALRRTEARLMSGADLAGLAFYELDYDQRLGYFDARLRELCGVPPETDGFRVVDHWAEHVHPDDRPRVLDLRRQLHEGRLPQLSVEYRFLHPTRGPRWIHHLARVARRDPSGRAVIAYGVLRDVSDRKRADEELADLSRRLIRAHEEERALLARELHDDVTQRLAVLAIDVGRAEHGAADGAQAETMRAVREALARLSEDVHSLAYQLHPSVLDELGLAEALRTACERLERTGGVAPTVTIDPIPADLDRDAALCMFRVAQEALANVARHARARSASVALRRMDGGYVLAVRDDGVGFDPASPGARRSLGLASMRERVRLLNGTLDIESTPGKGTALVAWIPGAGES